MSYYKKKTISLKNSRTVETIKFDYEIADTVVGFSGFGLGYGYKNGSNYKDKIDHHVRSLSLDVTGGVDGTDRKNVTVSITAEMCDDSGNRIDYSDSRVDVVVIAVPKSDQLPRTEYHIQVLKSFGVTFAKENDHHVKMLNSYGLQSDSDGETPYIMDDSGNDNVEKNSLKPRSTVSRLNKILELPAGTVIPNILSDFMIGRDSGDSHVHFIGLFLNNETGQTDATYYLEDKHDNHAEPGSCAFSLAYQNSPGNSKNPIVENVLSAFNSIQTKGEKENLNYRTNTPSVNLHLQSALVFDESNKQYWMVSHSDGDFILFQNKKEWFVIKSGFSYFGHLSGMQRIGDYCALAMEAEDGGDKSSVRFYDLRGMSATNSKRPLLLNTKINRNDRRATCVGITQLGKGESAEYLVAVYYYCDMPKFEKVDFYRSSAKNGLEGASFSWCGTVDMRDKSNVKIYDNFQNIGLVPDITGKIYLIGLSSGDYDSGKADYVDHADLFEIIFTPNALSVDSLAHEKQLTLSPTHGSVLGVMGIHFRYAGGVEIANASEIKLLMTERNCNAKELDVNVFSKKKVKSRIMA